MPEPEQPAASPEPPIPSGLSEAGRYSTQRDADQHGLVILASGREYWCLPAGQEFQLLVDQKDLPLVSDQLARFERESIGWPPRPTPPPTAGRMAFGPALLWVLAVLAANLAQNTWPGPIEKFAVLDGTALFDRGEVWRPFTSLFLHADIGHLVGNLVAGLGVFSALGATLGLRRAWLLLALASIAGNCVSAALHYPQPYHSLGASTAVFAGLGLLTGRASRLLTDSSSERRLKTLLIPLATGIVLLALYGTGGLHTDILAHATGFASGLALGFLCGRAR